MTSKEKSIDKQINDILANQGQKVGFGDILISHMYFEIFSPDSIIHKNDSGREIILNRFDDFLKTLELIVINEHVSIVKPDPLTFKDFDDTVWKSPGWAPLEIMYMDGGELEIKDYFFQELGKRNILSEGIIAHDGLLPTEYIQMLKKEKDFKGFYDSYLEGVKCEEKNDEIAEQVLDAHFSIIIGFPLYLSNFAGDAKIPFILSPYERRHVEPLENFFNESARSLRNILFEKYSEGARKITKEIADFGGNFIYPSTPIASEIILNSSSPKDLVNITIDLRDHYQKFRKVMCEMESALVDEDISISNKKKIIREMKFFFNELWPESNDIINKELKEYSNFIGGLPKDIMNLKFGSPIEIYNSLSNFPLESLIKRLKKRKISALLNSKKTFLKSKNIRDKISNIFSINKTKLDTQINEFLK